VVPGAVTKTRRSQPVGGRGLGCGSLLVHESSSKDGAQGLAIRRFAEPGTLARAGERCRVELHRIHSIYVLFGYAYRSKKRYATQISRHKRCQWLGGVNGRRARDSGNRFMSSSEKIRHELAPRIGYRFSGNRLGASRGKMPQEGRMEREGSPEVGGGEDGGSCGGLCPAF
jgi:hypothetical protein